MRELMMKSLERAAVKTFAKIQSFRTLKEFFNKNGGFGMNELLGIAAALILAAFIIIPGLRTFAGSVMSRLTTWWSGTVVSNIFPTS